MSCQVKGYIFLVIFLLLNSSLTLAQDPLSEEWDLIYNEMTHSFLTDDGKVQDQLNRAYTFLKKAKKAERTILQARVLEALGDFYINKANFINQDSAIYYKNQALIYYSELGETSYRIDALQDLGISLKDFSRYSEGEKYLFEALALSEEENDKNNISQSYRILCDFCRHKKEYNEAVYYGELAIKIAKENKLSSNSQFGPLLCLITAYRKNGQPEIAIQKASELIDAIEEKNHPKGNLNYIVNQRIESYVSVGNTEAAIKDMEIILIKNGISRAHFSDAPYPLYFYLKKEYKKAIPIYKRSIESELKYDDFESLQNNFPRLIDCYEKIGDFENAYQSQKEYVEFLKKLSSRELASTKNELRIKYETEKNESTILNQELRISQQSQLVKYSLGIASLLMLLFAGLIYLYRNNKRKNKQLEFLAVQLKELDQFKSQLYTNITHEFRTPLTVIMGMIDNIKGHTQEKKLIQRNSKNLLRLVSQLLDLSKLESGSLTLHLVEGNIVNYIQYLTESFYSMAQDKNVRLTFYSEEKEIRVYYDEHKIQHVIYNMLSNAIKFTEDGGKVVLHLKKLAISDASKSNIQIIIKDTGIGIPAEVIPRLFDRFYQADNSSTRSYEGTGIGLAFVNELVKFMDGEIQVESEVGLGTTFKIALPLKEGSVDEIITNKNKIIESNSVGSAIPIKTNTSTPPLNETKDKPIVLIVEDNLDVLHYIQTLLQDSYQIFTAKNGDFGIKKAIEHIPDIIISDVMMPVKDGYELCETLKQDQKTSHIPIILLTAKATTEDRVEGLKFGADAYLTKPFKKEELLVRLDQLVALRKKLQNRYAQTPEASFQEPASEIEDAFLQKIRSFVEANLNNPAFSVPDLETALLMSKTQVYRKIKALTDRSPSSFIRYIRLQKAKQMLLNTKQGISEIAYDVGFNDPNYFSRCFHEEFGKSPSAFRI